MLAQDGHPLAGLEAQRQLLEHARPGLPPVAG
jgi:hypothetical protein